MDSAELIRRSVRLTMPIAGGSDSVDEFVHLVHADGVTNIATNGRARDKTQNPDKHAPPPMVAIATTGSVASDSNHRRSYGEFQLLLITARRLSAIN
jgi:hypothetical protein